MHPGNRLKSDVHNLPLLARILFEDSADALFLFDPDTGQILEANAMAQSLTGFAHTHLIGLSIGHLFRSEIPSGLQRLRRACRRATAFPSQEGFLLRHSKQGMWLQVALAVTRFPTAPKALGVITAHDLSESRAAQRLLKQKETELYRARESVRANEASYHTLVENLEQCIFLKDEQFHFVAVNPPFCRAVGRRAEEILGRTDFDFYPREMAEKFRADDEKVLAQGARIETEEESRLGDQIRTVRVVKTPVRHAGKVAGVLGIFWDVTEQRALEAQLRQAQKMEAIGQLAGGVAHDFNNLLTAILGNLSLLSNIGSLDVSAREMVKAAEQAALRAAGLTSQLLGFSRRTLLRPEPANLNSTVDEVVALLRRTIDPRITLAVRKDPELWPVLADAGQMNQVLMNLCLNARDAMPDGGRLTIETTNAVMSPEKVRLKLEARSGDFVCLQVRDTGCGMTPEVQARVFEPFFTTKGPGKGTGLGLAMVFGIAKQHQGWVECDSTSGQGTGFTLFLPRHVQTTPDGTTTASHQEQTPLSGTETILFVDDEGILRDLGRTILQRHGYQVLVAADGVQALEIFRQERSRIDLIILDLTMPRLSGRDTFRQIRALDAQIPILFASGYSSQRLSPEETGQISGFVAKPYRPRELTTLVREVLDQKGSSTGE
jgi:two-component system, cell cycle sensor histidine kinase and response regulator CckA